MIKTHSKLVRDRIPEIIEASGRRVYVEILDDSQFAKALREKLVEEAREVQLAEESDLCVELADLQEIVDTLLTYYGFSREEVETVQRQRRAERGGFERRLWLGWTE